MIPPPDHLFGSLYEYLDSRTSALGLLLFWFGSGALICSLFMMTVDWSYSVNEIWPFGIALYGVFSVALGLHMRRGSPRPIWIAVGSMLLAIAVGFAGAAYSMKV